MAEPITGSRKRAKAKIFLQSGTGIMKINGRKPLLYFGRQELVDMINIPLVTAGVAGTVDINARVIGGGIAGQAGAVSLGIAKALIKQNPDLRASLKSAGLLRRDPREKERMKYGHAKRRKRFQFSKR
ncbi:30S ribosomal protein S9 [candidate division WOR-3 bacterium RBG_13_43_14]|uniref:30S ribosomal protein S9 n=1 Tax=candidate division WOR-3 bacterium RBG_13_43_14 TaxID=1802590 RepID=A0A1F4UCL4_UNCW3|nr:MAG: 30S ribosomal protein S9 [candidate division WOR-3 bacterium RBG_13_43_14]